MLVINLYDYLLIPFYLIVFYILARRMSSRYEYKIKKYFWISFSFHIAGSILFAVLIQYYYGGGDSIEYYKGGELINNLFSRDIHNIQLLSQSGEKIQSFAESLGYNDQIPVSIVGEANATIMKVSSIISWFSFHRYIEISLLFGALSFVGNWNIFYILNDVNKRKMESALAIAILCIPSIWFWGSGLNKESICIFSLGMMISALYNIWITKRKIFSSMFIFSICIVLLTLIKGYITVIFLISIGIVLFFKFFGIVRNKVQRALLLVMSMVILALGIALSPLPSILQETFMETVSQMELFQNAYQSYADETNSETTFSGTLDLSPEQMLLTAPSVIFTTLFRPYLWESRKIIMLFSSLEALITLIFTFFVLWKTRVWGFFVYTFNNPITFFCFIFSMLFAALIGFTTFNFGTLVRYKIIFLPFYFFLLISSYSRYMSRIPEN